MSQDRAQWRRKISEWSSAVANPHRGRSYGIAEFNVPPEDGRVVSEWVVMHRGPSAVHCFAWGILWGRDWRQETHPHVLSCRTWSFCVKGCSQAFFFLGGGNPNIWKLCGSAPLDRGVSYPWNQAPFPYVLPRRVLLFFVKGTGINRGEPQNWGTLRLRTAWDVSDPRNVR